MTNSIKETDSTGHDLNTRAGIGYMVGAMLLIPMCDGIAKYLSSDFSPLFISWSRYAVAVALLLPFAWKLKGKRMVPTQNLGTQTLRTLFLLAAMTLYFSAIAQIPLTLALSAYFIGPVITVFLSVLFLGERLTIRKLVALVLGLAGSLVILRPDGALNTGVLMAFGAGFFFALYLIATRKAASNSDPLQTLVFQCILGAVLLFPQAAMTWSTPQPDMFIFFLALGLFSVVGHLLSIVAFRYAEASILAPLVYVELVGTSIVGFLIFQEVPERATIAGAACIVAAGLITLPKRQS